MTIYIDESNVLRRILFLIYAEEARSECGMSYYKYSTLSRLKKKVRKQLERSEKNEKLDYDASFIAI